MNSRGTGSRSSFFSRRSLSFSIYAAVPSQEHKENLQALPRMSGLNGGARLNWLRRDNFLCTRSLNDYRQRTMHNGTNGLFNGQNCFWIICLCCLLLFTRQRNIVFIWPTERRKIMSQWKIKFKTLSAITFKTLVKSQDIIIQNYY